MKFDASFRPCKTSRFSLSLLATGAVLALLAIFMVSQLGAIDTFLIIGSGALIAVGLVGMFYSVGRGYEQMVRKFKQEMESQFGLRLTQSQACQFLGDTDHDSWLITHRINGVRQDAYLSRTLDGNWNLTAR